VARCLLDLLQILFLGLLQGVTEWLPVSSTAHLKLAETFLDVAVTPFFNLILHMATLLAVLLFFRKEIKNILSALMHWNFKSEDGRLIPRIVVATIPTAIIGLAYSLFLQDSLGTIPIIAVTFFVGAIMVYTTRFAKEETDSLSYKTVLLMGLAQGFAIFPGLSRSGVTISMALLLGLKREKAFRFSFLISIPAIVGDFAVEGYTQRGQFSLNGMDPTYLVAGFMVAAVVGFFAIKLLSRVVRGRRFHYFAFYTAALGIALLLWSLLVR
jgi:undecaprenyl-diphosphatase